MKPIAVKRSDAGRRFLLPLYAALVAFLTYASVYAYRKPFTVGGFDTVRYAGISYQSLLIICQVIGYMLSKFTGIRLIASLKRKGRWKTAAVLLSTAWVSLFCFAVVPDPWAMLFFVVNGFALGFLWGIVFSYVEGRRSTDFIGAVMAISFIFAGGFTRTVARWLMDVYGVPGNWMPFATGALFAGPLVLLLFALEKLPPPDEADIADRTERVAMTKTERRQMLRQLGAGIVILAVMYTLLTILRDLRDNFMGNLWTELGYGSDYSVFTKTETKTSLIILALMAMLVTVRKNFLALQWVHGLVIAGFAIAGVSTLLYNSQVIDGVSWMQLTGLGLYMAYIPCNCLLFERMIAAFRLKGNAGFLMYVIDACGYLGSAAIIISKELFSWSLHWVPFYSGMVLLFSAVGIAGTCMSSFYLISKYRKTKWQLRNPLSLSGPA